MSKSDMAYVAFLAIMLGTCMYTIRPRDTSLTKETIDLCTKTCGFYGVANVRVDYCDCNRPPSVVERWRACPP